MQRSMEAAAVQLPPANTGCAKHTRGNPKNPTNSSPTQKETPIQKPGRKPSPKLARLATNKEAPRSTTSKKAGRTETTQENHAKPPANKPEHAKQQLRQPILGITAKRPYAPPWAPTRPHTTLQPTTLQKQPTLRQTTNKTNRYKQCCCYFFG